MTARRGSEAYSQVACGLYINGAHTLASMLCLIFERSNEEYPSQRDSYESPESRPKWVDVGTASQWFKTVTRDTWDDNNFYPHDDSKNPIRGLQLWRQAANATLPTHVR